MSIKDCIVHRTNLPFECSSEITFSPHWTSYSFDTKGKFTENNRNNLICIVPRNQLHTEEKLLAIDSSLIIFRLENESAISKIVDYIKHNNVSQVFFVCQSSLHQAVDEAAYALFLSLIQALTNSCSTLAFDIISTKAQYNPYSKSLVHPLDSVYIGLGQTIEKELTHWSIRTFNLDDLNKKNLDRIKYYLFEKNPALPSPIDIIKDNYYLRSLSPVNLTSRHSQTSFKQNGIYLIIGGNGGIGSILSDYLVKNYNAQLILVGRKEPSNQQRERYKNKSVVFEQVDMASAESVESLFNRHPKIDGVIHSALVLDDASIITMKTSQLLNVLAPKVSGTLNLINAIRYRSLDFVLFFSSIQSFIANAGQANYTAACVCKDAMSYLLNEVFLINSKIINWGYWGKIGIVAKDFYRQRMEQLEIGSIEVEEGLDIIERFLQSDLQQLAVVKGSNQALKRLGLKQDHLTLQSKNTVSNTEQKYYAEIVPPYDPRTVTAINNNKSMQALENYVRHRIHQIIIPDNIIPRYHQLSKAISLIDPASSPDKDTILVTYPELEPHINLLETCLNHLPSILTGQIDALSVLFPNGSFELVEPIYRNNPIADYYNQQVAEIIVNYIKEKRKHSNFTIRILEIGAGTGSTSKIVIPTISGMNVEYTYTDLSLAFLNKAKRTFSEYDFIKYDIYNVEKPYKENNYFDIVIATNVIHATKDIYNTITNTYNLLNDEGIFILNEITRRQDFATLTFGLTEGWWLSTEPLRIPNSPLLSIETWQNVLTDCHFDNVVSHGEVGQHIIVGFINRKMNKTKGTFIANTHPEPTINKGSINKAKSWLKETISSVMHIPQQEIEDHIPFSQYGIDSLITLELIEPMKKVLGYIPATILFEYPTIDQLANYLNLEFSNKFQVTVESNFKPSNHQASVSTNNKTLALSKLKTIISNTMHMPVEELEEHIPLNDYGIDSLISLEILKPLQAEFGYLPATLLFEYPTIGSLADFLSNIQPITNLKTAQSNSADIRVDSPNIENLSDTILDDCIAIIGISGRFPMAENCDELWSLLKNGTAAYSKIPDERWSQHYNDKNYTSVGAFLDDIDAFDHAFFNITPIEAERMDPQERLFLQTAYHAIQDAGISFENLSGKAVGCYVGVMNHSYSQLTTESHEQGNPSSLFWSIANRASYLFNWRGPSFAIDSACSSSLTALHTAVMALKNDDCDVAVVGGVNLIVHPRQYEDLCQLHMLSPSGKCQPFAEGSDGFVDGEGIVCVVVKRYQDAINDSDKIYGVIRSSAINAGGKANGYTAPNPDAQASMIKKALQRAKLTPADIGYIEAHGTGTELGDPIEVRGITKAFETSDKQSIAMGSIKGNLGHLESAAGLTSVIKALLQMKHKMIAPSIHCNRENPHLQLINSPVYLNTRLQPWPENLPLRSCISSFGAGGANAHVIIEAHDNSHVKQEILENKYYLFPLSAHSEQSLQRQVDDLRQIIISTDATLDQISYGYCCVRSQLKYRVGFVANNKNYLLSLLNKNLQQLYKNSDNNFQKIDCTRMLEDYLNSNQQNQHLAENLINAYVAGNSISFEKLFTKKPLSYLPLYPFDRHRHWVAAKETNMHKQDSIIEQHTILGHNMAPASFSLTKLIEASNATIIQSTTWKIIITDLDQLEMSISNSQFKLKDKNSTKVYCEGIFKKETLGDIKTKNINPSPQSAYISGTEIYQYFNDKGYRYGRYFKAIKCAYIDKTKIFSLIEINKDWGYKLSPIIIDAGLQTAILSNKSQTLSNHEIMVPYFIETIMIYRIPKNEPIYCVCTPKTEMNNMNSNYDIEFSDVHGQILMSLQGVISVKTSIDKLINKITEESNTPIANLDIYELN